MATSIPKTKTKWATAPLPEISDSERVELSYSGKKLESDVLRTPPASPQILWSGGTTNQLYYGDNLPFLSYLLNKPSVRGKVRLIYIDPPYATNGVFQSRAQNDAYQDLLTGAHYLEFVRHRLILLRELLAEDGSIYVHLDENMAFYIKVLMDVFVNKKKGQKLIEKRANKNHVPKKVYQNQSQRLIEK
jgi:adenine-specific DNA-methyltransferase